MSHSGKKRVLIVEDDNPIRELIAIRVDLAGHTAVPVCNGLEALRKISENHPDAIILDIGLPAVDGFGVLARMSKCRWSIPTLILTARNSESDVQKAIGLGAWDYLSKPFDDKVLLQRLERLFRPKSEICFV